mgnify:FL=1
MTMPLISAMRVFATLLSVLLSLPVTAAAPFRPTPSPVAGVTPLHSYAEALHRASASRKNVLLLFSNPHCGPCRAVEGVLFMTESGAELISESYVPVHLVLNLGGTDKTPETREARSVATRFGVKNPPALLVVSRSGAKLGNIVGIRRPEILSGLRYYAKPVP